MTEELENKVIQIAALADEVCGEVPYCDTCPLAMKDNDGKPVCTINDLCVIAVKIQEKRYQKLRYEEPTYEDLPIDLDDDYHCDECYKPVFNECLTGKYNDDCPYGLGECCEDNLATNVGRICFEHNVSTNVAMAIIEIIQKERDRNEYLHLYRKHIEAE